MTKDQRTYITLHDGMPENGKIRPLSDKAFRTLIEIWCWCSRERNDGNFTEKAFRTFGTPRARAELIDAGEIEPTPTGFRAHDFLSHQRSRAEIEALSAIRSEAGKKGGRPAKRKLDETNLLSKPLAKKTHSHSHSQKTEDKNLTSLPESGSEELSPGQDDPVSNPVFESVVEAVAAGGIRLNPIVVPTVIAFIESRRGPRAAPVRVPARYYAQAIRSAWPEVQQFIYQEGLAS
jgi:hypothetical protein